MKRFASAMLCMFLFTTTPSVQAANAQLPDLVPHTPYSVYVGVGATFTGPVLRFTLEAMNVGDFPLDILGLPNATTGVSEAWQCVAWEVKGCLGREDRGVLRYEVDHGHYHFEGFAKYELRLLTPSGDPDLSTDALVSARKQDFCLEDSQTRSGAVDAEASQMYVSCTPLLQGISPGWADIYPAELTGQELPITDVPSGVYALLVTLNPDGSLLESTTTNDSAFVRVRISRYADYVEAHVLD